MCAHGECVHACVSVWTCVCPLCMDMCVPIVCRHVLHTMCEHLRVCFAPSCPCFELSPCTPSSLADGLCVSHAVGDRGPAPTQPLPPAGPRTRVHLPTALGCLCACPARPCAVLGLCGDRMESAGTGHATPLGGLFGCPRAAGWRPQEQALASGHSGGQKTGPPLGGVLAGAAPLAPCATPDPPAMSIGAASPSSPGDRAGEWNQEKAVAPLAPATPRPSEKDKGGLCWGQDMGAREAPSRDLAETQNPRPEPKWQARQVGTRSPYTGGRGLPSPPSPGSPPPA